MDAALSLIPELEEVVQHGSREKRTEALQRITALFVNGAGSYKDEHVDVFDEVFGLLIEEIENKARAELSHRLAPVSNAPVKVLRRLANDDDIAVAGPVLKLAPRLAEADLIDVAETKSQAHLHAISGRRALGEAVTDVLVRRGNRDVARRVADNRSARISEQGFYRLVKRAEEDGILAEKVGLRPDIPAADVSRFAEQSDRGRPQAADRLGDARTESGDLRYFGKGLDRSRRPRRPARLSRGAAHDIESRPGEAIGRADAGGILRARTNTKRRSLRSPRSPKCRSRLSTG